jgi:hypothetical protein
MSVEKYLPAKLRSLKRGSVAFQKLTEKKRLASQPCGACVRRKKISQFVAEDGGATRLEHYDRDSCINLPA